MNVQGEKAEGLSSGIGVLLLRLDKRSKRIRWRLIQMVLYMAQQNGLVNDVWIKVTANGQEE